MTEPEQCGSVKKLQQWNNSDFKYPRLYCTFGNGRFCPVILVFCLLGTMEKQSSLSRSYDKPISSGYVVSYFKLCCTILLFLYRNIILRLDLVCEPPCGQRWHGPASNPRCRQRRVWAEFKERAQQEGTKTELGFVPGQTHGGFTQKGGVMVCRPSLSPFWDTQAGGVG